MLIELERTGAEGLGSRMETFEQIRRDRDREGLSIRALSARHGVHRRAVRLALASLLPPPKRSPSSRPAPKLGPYRAVIDGWLEADRDAPRKQRHTARRVWQRLVAEHGAQVSERQVSRYVRQRRRELGEVGEAFVPQCHEPGAEGEVDWGEAWVLLAGRRTKVHLFHLRLCHSGAAFAAAFLNETQQAFLEAHAEAFAFLGGVPAILRYDNLGSAVKQVLKGRRRVESDRFVALRSHFLFESAFTLVGLQGAHEKGGVEGEVGRFRRRHLVPVPDLASLAGLNAMLRAGCEADLDRRITAHPDTVGEALARERPLLRVLPDEPAQIAEQTTPRVDAKALVTVRQNRYSVPVGLVGLRVTATIGAREITISHAGRQVARHDRLVGRFGVAARLDHYLELLARKPAALIGSVALAQERERGAWPDCLDELWARIVERYGPSEAARQMVDVLMLAREHGPAQAELAVRGALAAGAHDGRAVAVLARRAGTTHQAAPAPLTDLEPRLAAHARPAPDLADYDQLLAPGGTR
jgi:transposase